MMKGPGAAKRGELGLAVGVVGILLVMMLPMPSLVMDLLLAANIAFSLLLLCVAIYLQRPLEFTVFPSLLLLATLLRLGLNVATTRLILLHGYEGTQAAGRVIETFGNFVVGGNYVVGGIVFLILVLINFIVITKGSERVAEVSARFTLDAMPGKQMAVDSELAAGSITEEQARTRRAEIEQEADFYGAMDGSSKFVRGDAIAGLIITGINIIGGLVIGTAQQGMAVGDAAMTYSLLTIGDGLVSQMPALMVSTSAGIVMTRAATDGNLSSDILQQFAKYAGALKMVAGVLFLMGFIPGMPTMILFGLATLLFVISRNQTPQKQSRPEQESVPEPVETADMLRQMLPVEDMELEFGYSLVKLVDGDTDGDLLGRIKAIRRQFALEQGFIVPPIHIRDNLRLEPDLYRVLIRGVEVGRGRLMADRLMAMNPGNATEEISGIPGKEPAFGMDALWIEQGMRERAESAGYTVVDCSTVVATHLTEIIRRHAQELLGRQEAQELIEVVARRSPKLVEDLIPNVMSLSEVLRVLKLLVAEEVSIRDLAVILETLADEAPRNKDPIVLTEAVRGRLSPGICQKIADSEGILHAVTLSAATEQMLRDRLLQTENGPVLAIDVQQARDLVSRLQELATMSPQNPLLIVSSDLRRAISDLLRKFVPQLTVLSHTEVQPRNEVRTLGSISLETNNGMTTGSLDFSAAAQVPVV